MNIQKQIDNLTDRIIDKEDQLNNTILLSEINKLNKAINKLRKKREKLYQKKMQELQ